MSAQVEGGDARLSWEEFLRFQQAYAGDERFVWDEGRVVLAMTGGTERHDLVTMALAGRLIEAFRGSSCRVFAHNRQVKTTARSYYPDILVRCGRAADPYFEDDARLIIEVLSPSNRPTDRTRMLYDYQTLPSIQAILFVDTRRRTVTVHERTQDGAWTEGATSQGEVKLGPAVLDFAAIWSQVDEESTFD